MIRLLCLFAQTVRTVRHHNARDPEPFDRLGKPEIFPGTQTGLFFKRHFLHKLFDV